MDPVILARLQFALTIVFHFIFPPITIGLAWLLVVLEWKGWRTGEEVWRGSGQVLRQAVGAHLCRRRGHRHRHGVPVRHQLGQLFQVRRRHLRRAAGRRRRVRLLPGVQLPRAVSVRAEPGLQGRALVLHPDGGRRGHHLRILDPRGQLVAADAGRLRGQAARSRRADELRRGGVQPLHGPPLLPHHTLPHSSPAPSSWPASRRSCCAADRSVDVAEALPQSGGCRRFSGIAAGALHPRATIMPGRWRKPSRRSSPPSRGSTRGPKAVRRW